MINYQQPLTPQKNVLDDRSRFRVMGGVEPVYITGKCKYARLSNPDPVYEKWSIAVYPADQADLDKIKKLKEEGIKNELKKDDDGYYMTFSRPLKIKRKTGQVQPMEAPVVTDKEGVIVTEMLGNGSDVTIKLETYGGAGPGGFGRYKAARLAAVRVNNLVPYTVPDLGENAVKQARGLQEQPEQIF